jgi:hypothetical protein
MTEVRCLPIASTQNWPPDSRLQSNATKTLFAFLTTRVTTVRTSTSFARHERRTLSHAWRMLHQQYTGVTKRPFKTQANSVWNNRSVSVWRHRCSSVAVKPTRNCMSDRIHRIQRLSNDVSYNTLICFQLLFVPFITVACLRMRNQYLTITFMFSQSIVNIRFLVRKGRGYCLPLSYIAEQRTVSHF